MTALLHRPQLVDERLVRHVVSGRRVDRDLTVAERKAVALRMSQLRATPAAIAAQLDVPASAVAAFLACEARE